MPRPRPIFALVGCSFVVSTALVACRSDGRTLRPAQATQNQSVYTPTTTTVPATTVSVVDPSKFPPVVPTTVPATIAVPFTLQLPFVDGALMDPSFTCNGIDVHPQIAWYATPSNAVEVALVVTDADAGDFVHWIIAGLSPADPLIGEGSVPVGAIEGQNGFSSAATPVIGWRGPCPPAGTTHHYRFNLYALGQQVELPTGSAADDLVAVIEAASIDGAEVTGVYTAPAK